MPEIMISGDKGRLETLYHFNEDPSSPMVLILHPHPLYGGTMRNKVVNSLHRSFYAAGFSTVRFNFRGVGRSLGEYSKGEGELADASVILNWMQSMREQSKKVWIAGYSFGAWIAMQMLMRRPEISCYVAVAPPVNRFDFSFLAPCPTSGLIVYGKDDEDVPLKHITDLEQHIANQRVADVALAGVDGDHFFTDNLQNLEKTIYHYITTHMDAATVI